MAAGYAASPGEGLPREQAAPQTARGLQHRKALVACCLIGLAQATGPTISTLLPPTTPSVFGLSQTERQLTTNIGVLLFVLFVLGGGALGDLFGRKRIFMIGAIGFVVVNAVSAFSINIPMFVTLRLLAGVFGALIAALALAVIRTTFHPHELPIALGVYTGLFGVGQMASPLLTQLVQGIFDWRVTFILPVVFGVLGIYVARGHVHESAAAGGRGRKDAISTVAWAAILLALVFGLTDLGNGVYDSRYIFVALGVGVVGLLTLTWLAITTHGQALGSSLPNKRALTIAVIAGVIIALVFGGILIQFVNFFLTIQHRRPLLMVLSIAPVAPGLLLGGLLVSRYANRVGARTLISGGLAIMGLSAAALSFITPDISYVWLWLPIFFLGLGFNLANTSVIDTLLGLVSRDLAGAAAGITESVGRIGGALGPAVSGVLLLRLAGIPFRQRLEAAGLTSAQIQQAANALNDVLQNTEATIPKAILDRLVEGYREYYATGLGQALLIAAAACLVCAALVRFGMPKHTAAPEK